MWGIFGRNQAGRLAFVAIITLLILSAMIRPRESPNLVAHAERLGFDDPFCGSGWTHKDETPPFVISAGSGIFVRVGIKSSSSCQIAYSNGSTTDGCYGVSGIGTSTVSVAQLSSEAGCHAIGHIVAELQVPPPTRTSTPTSTATATSTPTPTSTATATSTSTSTSTATPTSTPTKTPPQGTTTSQPATPSPTAQTRAPSPTGTTRTPTGVTSITSTRSPAAPAAEALTPTQVQEQKTALPMVPVTGPDPCCQRWYLPMLLLLVLQMATIAGVLALVAYIRRRARPRS